MKSNLLTILSLILFTACRSQTPPDRIQREGKPYIQLVSTDDSAMNAAIAAARASLPRFDAALQSGNSDLYGFAIKVRFGPEDDGEHMWVAGIEKDQGEYYGIVNNDPEFTKEVAYGDTIKIDKTRISDWMYVENGKLRGGYTIRYARNRMTPAERAAFDKDQGLIIED